MTHTTFSKLVRATIERSSAVDLLMVRPAVVLERIARGGGATRWFWLTSPDQLEQLCERLSPGSVVSFYFDERIARMSFDDVTTRRILEIASADGDAVVGRLDSDGLELIVEFVGGSNALNEFVDAVRPGEDLFVGPFPARDDDARSAVTITLPDSDGVARPHPH